MGEEAGRRGEAGKVREEDEMEVKINLGMIGLESERIMKCYDRRRVIKVKPDI